MSAGSPRWRGCLHRWRRSAPWRPVIGVVATAKALGEPLGVIQIVARVFTLAGLVLVTRS
jgi:hypothetical protein